MAPSGPPVAGGRWKAVFLALAVHLLLVALLVVGIRWKTTPPPALQAELFTPIAVPEPPPPPPPPPPEPVPQPKPVPTPAPEIAKPDIVTEQVRKEKLEAERLEAERREQERKRAEELAKRKAAEEKKKADEAEKKKAEELARKKAEELARKKAEDAAKKKAEEDKKKAAEQARKEAIAKAKKEEGERARRAAEEKAERESEAQRSAYLKELMDKAAAPGGTAAAGGRIGSPGGAGAGAPGGTDSGYRTLLSARIRESTVFAIPPDLSGNPKAVFAVTVQPDCTIAAVRLRRSSGVPAWDQAAERGIQRASPLPRMRDGSCPPELEITRGPRDLE